MRGFVTLATGNKHYYELALNLYKSYRMHTDAPLPFAIIADKENEYTRQFEKTIILDNPTYSYMDKIEMLNNAPFEENIFIDADCLAYSDLNLYWKYFPKMGGVSCFGKCLGLDSKDGWFEIDDIGQYKSNITFIPQMHGGIIFFKKDDLTIKIYNECMKISENYNDYKFKYFSNPADEPILSLAMAYNGCKPIELEENQAKEMFLFYPIAKKIKENMRIGQLMYTIDGDVWYSNVKLLHWQNLNTHKPKYKLAVDYIYNISSNGWIRWYKIILYYALYYGQIIGRKICKVYKRF